MAYDFDGSTQYLKLSSILGMGSVDVVYSAWQNGDSTPGTAMYAISRGLNSGAATNQHHHLYWTTSDEPSFSVRGNSAPQIPVVGAAGTAGTWASSIGEEASTTDHSVWKDGTEVNVTTTRDSGFSTDFLSVGAFGASTPSNYFNGKLAEVAIWDLAGASSPDWTQRDADSIAAGFSPLLVRPQYLKVYMPLVGNIVNWIDYDSGRASKFTNTGSTAKGGRHPRVFMRF